MHHFTRNFIALCCHKWMISSFWTRIWMKKHLITLCLIRAVSDLDTTFTLGSISSCAVESSLSCSNTTGWSAFKPRLLSPSRTVAGSLTRTTQPNASDTKHFNHSHCAAFGWSVFVLHNPRVVVLLFSGQNAYVARTTWSGLWLAVYGISNWFVFNFITLWF